VRLWQRRLKAACTAYMYGCGIGSCALMSFTILIDAGSMADVMCSKGTTAKSNLPWEGFGGAPPHLNDRVNIPTSLVMRLCDDRYMVIRLSRPFSSIPFLIYPLAFPCCRHLNIFLFLSRSLTSRAANHLLAASFQSTSSSQRAPSTQHG
jgi:hypothetical protein